MHRQGNNMKKMFFYTCLKESDIYTRKFCGSFVAVLNLETEETIYIKKNCRSFYIHLYIYETVTKFYGIYTFAGTSCI